MKITANSRTGRILLALRAGPMSVEQLCERSGCRVDNLLFILKCAGLVEEDGDYRLHLTAAGRAACPSRRGAMPDYNLRTLGVVR